jgi:hypothetical protein
MNAHTIDARASSRRLRATHVTTARRRDLEKFNLGLFRVALVVLPSAGFSRTARDFRRRSAQETEATFQQSPAQHRAPTAA